MPDDIKGKVVSLISDAAKNRRQREKPAPAIAVSGDGNVVAGRDVLVKTERVVITRRVTITPGRGHVDAEQKAKLQALVKRWVELDKVVSRGEPLSYAAAWGSLNRRMKVNSYHELPSYKFPAAVSYLEQQVGRLNRTPTARRRSSSWRADRIKAIQARCNEIGAQEWRKAYMAERFGKGSMTELDDVELERLYGAVMAR